MTTQIDKNQLLGIYKNEMFSYFQIVEEGLLAFEKGRVDDETVQKIFRAAHTIKGSSHLLGLTKIATMAHSMETILAGIRDKTLVPGKEVMASLFAALDALKQEVEGLKPEEERRTTVELITVDAQRVDKLLNLMSELLIDKEKLADDTNAFRGLRNLVRNTPLEDVLLKLEDDYLATEMITEEMKNEILNLRLVPVSTLLTHFPRAVRDLAAASGKQIELVISGQSTQMDKRLVDELKEPLLHLIRNSCDHGIEPPQERQDRGKPSQGTIKINVYEKSGLINVEISDDGAGLDYEVIRQKAVASGLVSAEKAAQLSETELQEFIFQPGFSTAASVTDVSGRGVGMDVVKAKVKQLQGGMLIENKKDQGLTVILAVPMTLLLSYVQVIKIAGQKFAVPLSFIKEHFELTVPFSAIIQYKNESRPLYRLEEFLGFPVSDRSSRQVLVLSSLERQICFLVDEVLSEEQVVVKPLGNYLGKVDSVSGASILASGEVLLVLDVNDLIELSFKKEPQIPPKKIRPLPKPKKILVVEDALVTRELEKAILEAYGFKVETVSSAEDALIMLEENPYDLILLDVQLPKQDGLEFCRQLQAHPKLKTIPVVMLSVLDSDTDKKDGLAAGAKAYLAKQGFNQEELFSTIQQLL